MGPAVQGSTFFELDIELFLATDLFWRRQNANSAILTHIVDVWHFGLSEHLNLVSDLGFFQKPGEYCLQGACQLPKCRDGRAAFTLLDLADHGTGDTV